jgi:hypothetical protein
MVLRRRAQSCLFLRRMLNSVHPLHIVIMLTLEREAVFQLDYPRTPELLDKLYALDCEAYGRHAVDRSILARWVGQNPTAITLLMAGSDIAGAFGLLPLSEEQCRHFIAGQIGEKDLNCLPEEHVGGRFWYWSGLAMAPQYRKARKSPLKRLLMMGIDEWLMSDRRCHQESHIYSLGCSTDGMNLLSRFQFEQILPAEVMLDDAALYHRVARDTPTGQTELKGFFYGVGQ